MKVMSQITKSKRCSSINTVSVNAERRNYTGNTYIFNTDIMKKAEEASCCTCDIKIKFNFRAWFVRRHSLSLTSILYGNISSLSCKILKRTCCGINRSVSSTVLTEDIRSIIRVYRNQQNKCSYLWISLLKNQTDGCWWLYSYIHQSAYRKFMSSTE